jgi:hypothetical protein
MPYYGSNHNAEFQAGQSPLVNTTRSNDSSITLADGGLQADSDRWNALTPHGVLNSATAGSSDDSSWERLQRDQVSGYQPGSMTKMQDQIGNGTNDNLP